MTENWLQELGDVVVIRVKAIPRARRDEVRGVDGGVLKIAVTAPAEKGKANEAALTLLAKFLGVSRGKLQLLSGQSSRLKRVEVAGVSASQVEERLAKLER
ncbi:MAG: hypothetical protein A2Y63_03650 [Candidatus Riflebacteria bacterium RBG_13_59_9]|nr:MAG: hypothetical protein A2Y63_03650 [Candidatus Riflebacteria bacterium RBG_13_59_9]